MDMIPEPYPLSDVDDLPLDCHALAVDAFEAAALSAVPATANDALRQLAVGCSYLTQAPDMPPELQARYRRLGRAARYNRTGGP